jgi:MoxR-like ATPase
VKVGDHVVCSFIREVPGFRLVAAMNPFDAVGTAWISSAVYDRTCRIAEGYQSATDEERITALRSVVWSTR